MCRWAKAKGLLSTINKKSDPSDCGGCTPLCCCYEEGTARWMLAHGADLTAMSGEDETFFFRACASWSEASLRARAR